MDGVYQEQYDDHGSEVSVIDGRWLVLHFYGTAPNDEDTSLSLWFNIRKGSRFYLTGCDGTNIRTAPVRVSRKEFMDWVSTTFEREVEFTYDADQVRGTFIATTGYFVDGEGLYTCPSLPLQD